MRRMADDRPMADVVAVRFITVGSISLSGRRAGVMGRILATDVPLHGMSSRRSGVLR